jgi:hypothetical protein
LGHLFAPNDPDVLWENWVHHVAVTHFRRSNLCLWFLDVSS